jgi:hypothetical protein
MMLTDVRWKLRFQNSTIHRNVTPESISLEMQCSVITAASSLSRSLWSQSANADFSSSLRNIIRGKSTQRFSIRHSIKEFSCLIISKGVISTKYVFHSPLKLLFEKFLIPVNVQRIPQDAECCTQVFVWSVCDYCRTCQWSFIKTS